MRMWKTKNSKSRLLTVIFAAILLTVMLIPAAYGANAPSVWAGAEVSQARNAGLVVQEADGNFQGEISRELFCRLIVNMVEVATEETVVVSIENPFDDTDDENIVKAFQMGIVNGISTTSFAPESHITREQVAVMMMRAARTMDGIMDASYEASANTHGISFEDEGEISSWAVSDIKKANALGIMNGVGQERIDPKGTTTVEQSILLAYRLHSAFMAHNGGNGANANMAPVPKFDPYVGSDFLAMKTYGNMRADELAEDPEGDELTVVSVNGETGSIETMLGEITIDRDGTASYTGREVETKSTEMLVVTVTDGKHETTVNVLVTVVPSK